MAVYNSLVDVKNLKTSYFYDEGEVKAVDGVDLSIPQGKTLCLVGESGCGKSVTARSIMKLIEKPGEITEGEILFHRTPEETINIADLNYKGEEIRKIRGKEISMIFQEPMSCLSPIHTIGNQIIEMIRLHDIKDKKKARQRAIQLLRRVGLSRPEKNIDAYTFELSGGMRQRAAAAMAIACKPKLLIADEPTTALDVTTQANILDLFLELQEDMNMSVMFITHDLGVVAEIADEVAVMYLGKIVETGDVDTIFHNPSHPYTQGLQGSIPKLGLDDSRELASIRGMVPHPYNRPQGCSFHPRCDQFVPGLCNQITPFTDEIGTGRQIKCLLYSAEERLKKEYNIEDEVLQLKADHLEDVKNYDDSSATSTEEPPSADAAEDNTAEDTSLSPEDTNNQGETDDNLAPGEEDIAVFSQWKLMWIKFKKHKLALIGGTVTLIIYLIAIFGEFLAPVPPNQTRTQYTHAPPQSINLFIEEDDGSRSFRPHVNDYNIEIDPIAMRREFNVDEESIIPVGFLVRGEPYELFGLITMERRLFGPVNREDPMYLWGADRLGRDIMSRTIMGARISMSVGLVGVFLSLFLGILFGGMAGYYGGKVDTIQQRIGEFLESIPRIPLWMGLSAAIPSGISPIREYFFIIIILSIIGWTALARVVRGKFLALRQEDFVTAARLDGMSDYRIIMRHMVPSFLSHIIAEVTIAIPMMIIGETALSFLGIGLRPPVVSWGVLLQEAQSIRTLASAPWLLYPGLAVVISVLALNFLGDGLRDAADPYAS